MLNPLAVSVFVCSTPTLLGSKPYPGCHPPGVRRPPFTVPRFPSPLKCVVVTFAPDMEPWKSRSAPLTVPVKVPPFVICTPEPVITIAPLPFTAPFTTVLYGSIVSVCPFTSIAPLKMFDPRKCNEFASFKSTLHKIPTVVDPLKSAVSVSGLPFNVYESLNVIRPTVVTAARSFVITIVAAPAGNSNASPDTAPACGDQLRGSDHSPLNVPFHVLMELNVERTTSLPSPPR